VLPLCFCYLHDNRENIIFKRIAFNFCSISQPAIYVGCSFFMNVPLSDNRYFLLSLYEFLITVYIYAKRWPYIYTNIRNDFFCRCFEDNYDNLLYWTTCCLGYIKPGMSIISVLPVFNCEKFSAMWLITIV
jgi:hypothetical protein